MRLNQILTESEQRELETLQEGPLGSLVKAAGRGVGNVIGGVAKGVGAVKGAVKGAVDRVKKDFSAGEKGAYNALAGKKDAGAPATADSSAAGSSGGGSSTSGGGAAKPATQTQTLANPKDPNTGTTPAAQSSSGAAKPAQPQSKFNKLAGAAGLPTDGDAEQPAAGGTSAQPKAGAATAGTAQPGAQDTASQDAAAEPAATKTTSGGWSSKAIGLAKKQFDMLPDDQKKSIISMLQNDPDLKTAETPAAKQPPASGAQATTAQPQATAGRKQGGGKVAGQLSNSPSAVKRREQRAAKKGATTYTDTVQQKKLTPGGFGQMVTGLTKQNSSVEKTGNIIEENFSFFRKK